VALAVDVPVRCSPSVEAVAYFVVSEALTNVAKHARARTAEVTVTQHGKCYVSWSATTGGAGAVLESGGNPTASHRMARHRNARGSRGQRAGLRLQAWRSVLPPSMAR